MRLVDPDRLEAVWDALAVVARKAALRLPPLPLGTSTDLAGRLTRHADFSDIGASLLAVVAVDPVATW